MIRLAIHPSITQLFFFFGKQLLLIPLPLRTMAITLILVPLMVFVLLPALQKIFKGWLHG